MPTAALVFQLLHPDRSATSFVHEMSSSHAAHGALRRAPVGNISGRAESSGLNKPRLRLCLGASKERKLEGYAYKDAIPCRRGVQFGKTAVRQTDSAAHSGHNSLILKYAAHAGCADSGKRAAPN